VAGASAAVRVDFMLPWTTRRRRPEQPRECHHPGLVTATAGATGPAGGRRLLLGSDQERLRPGARRAVEDRVRRIVEQLMPLADRANRMLIRNLKAIKELRQASRTVTHFRVSSEGFTSVTSTCSKNGDIGDFGSRGR